MTIEYEEGLWPDGTPWKKIKPADAPNREMSQAEFEYRARSLGLIPPWKGPSASDAPPDESPPVPTLPKIGKEAIALALLAVHPDWTDAEIAKNVPCNRSSLYRFRKYIAARELMKTERMNRPRGSKSNGNLEAWNDDE